MIITPHALTACFIASWLRASPQRWRMAGKNIKIAVFILACLLSFLSHFLLDAMPHWDYSIKGSDSIVNIGNIILDLIIFAVTFIFIFHKPFQPLLESIFDLPKNIKEARLRRGTIYLLFLLMSASFFSLLPDILKNTAQMLDVPGLLFIEEVHNFLHTGIKLDPAVGSFMYFVYLGFIIFLFLNPFLNDQKLNLIERLRSELKIELDIMEIEEEFEMEKTK